MAIDDEVREVVKALRNPSVIGWRADANRAADLLEQLADRLNGLEEWLRKRAAVNTITLGAAPAFHVVRNHHDVSDECDD
jgi:hypothetical protein